MNLGNFIKSLQNTMRQDSGINGDAQRIEQITWLLFLKIYDNQEDNWELDEDDYKSIIPEKFRWKNWAVDNKDGKNLTGKDLLEFVDTELFPTLKNLKVTDSTPIKKSVVKTVFEDTDQYMNDGTLLRELVNKIDELEIDKYEDRHAVGEIYETILKSLQSAGNAGEFYTPRAVTDFIIDRIKPKIGEIVADFACGTGGFLTSNLNALEKQIKTAEDRMLFNQSVFGIEKKPLPYLLAITNMLLHGIDCPNIFHGNSLECKITDYKENEKFSVIVMNPPYGGTESESIKKLFPAGLQSSETADLFIALMIYRLKQGGRAAVIIPDGFLFGTDGAKLALKKKLVTELNLHTIIRLPQSVFAPYTSITTNILFFDKTKTTENIWFYRVDMPDGYKHFSKTKPMKLEHFADCQLWWDNRHVIEDENGNFKAKDFSVAEIADRNFDLDLCGYPSSDIEILSPADIIREFQEKFNLFKFQIEWQINNVNLLLSEKISNSRIDNNINQPYSKFTDVIKDFPKRLKASLLQAAIQGKLSEQLPTDGNARQLLHDIQLERQKLIKQKKIKAETLPPISIDEIPFDIPENWCWIRLGYIAEMYTGNSIPEHEKQSKYFGRSEGLDFIATKDVSSENTVDYNNGVKIPFDTKFKIAKENSVLMCIEGGSAGRKIAMLDRDVCFGNKLCNFNAYFVDNRFIYFYLQSPQFKEFFSSGIVGIIGGVGINKLKSILIPLPPLSEQKRIVGRLETLFQEI